MAEYEPLQMPEMVQLKSQYWLDRTEKSKIFDAVLFQLILDMISAKGGQRWRECSEITLPTENNSKLTIGYSAPSPETDYPFAWMSYNEISYQIRVGKSPGSETYSLFEVKNGAARQVSVSEIAARQTILSKLSKAFNKSLSK